MLRDAHHRNHSPLLTILHWHYVRAGELFSIIPLNGMADHQVNGGFPFDLPALRPSSSGEGGLLPQPGDFDNYPGFLDATIRYKRVKNLLESVAGLNRGPGQPATTSFPATRSSANLSAAAPSRFRIMNNLIG